MIDISVICPSLRVHHLPRLYNSLLKSCKKYKWELVVAGPFSPPDILLTASNFKFIQTYATVTVAMQKAGKICHGRLMWHTTDDSIALDDNLDRCIEQYDEECRLIDVLNLLYTEGVNFGNHGGEGNASFWEIENCPEFHLDGIDRKWRTSVTPLLSTMCFKGIGGFDCRFEFSNHAHHDLMFRIQADGGKIIHSKVPVRITNNMPMRTGDHGPVHDSQTGPDEKLFQQLYSVKTPTPRTVIPYENFESVDKPWARRFGEDELPKTYEELCKKQKYEM